MFDKLIQFSIRQRWLVLLLVALAAMAGIYNYQRLPIDAVPDITNVQVQINTEAPGYTPLEVEQRITFPLEIALGGLPRMEYTRSLSRYGLSQVTVIFRDGTNIYFARQLIAERRIRAGQPARGIERKWARSPQGSARSSCIPWRRSPAQERRRQAHQSLRSSQRSGLDHQAAAPQRAVLSRSTPSEAMGGKST
jgi:hypothetical protein